MLNSELDFAKRVVDKNVDKTLHELNHQQSERIKLLINHLMDLQREVMKYIICEKPMQQKPMHEETEEPPSFVANENNMLNKLFIKGELISPIEAVNLRKDAIENYLEKVNSSGKQCSGQLT